MIDSGYLQMAPEIMQEIDESMKTIHNVIAKSNDIAAQQQIIHALVKKPLPLSNDATRWKPLYFDDMIDSNVYQSFKSLVEKGNRVTGQQAFLIDIIQGKFMHPMLQDVLMMKQVVDQANLTWAWLTADMRVAFPSCLQRTVTSIWLQ